MTHSVVAATVVHRRLRPHENAFRYRVAYLCLGLEALECAAGRWLKLDRPGLVSFRRADHGARDGSDLAAWLRVVLAEHELANACDGEPVLITMPRMLGYVFNPVSFWFCRDRAGRGCAACYARSTTPLAKAIAIWWVTLTDEFYKPTNGWKAARCSTSRLSSRSRAAIAFASGSTRGPSMSM